jgi:CBS domain-containing protein
MTNARLLSKRDIAPVSAGLPGSTAEAKLPMTDAVTLGPEEPIGRAIRLLTRSRYSALPVVDVRGALVGLITERDLLIRLTGRKRSWWATFFADNPVLIQEYRKAVGTTVAEVMGPPPQPVPAGASVNAAAKLLVEQGLRELPVVADGRIVGMVSRPSLLALLELSRTPARPRTDAELVAEMKNRLHEEPWVTNRGLWVEANGGVLFLAGLVADEDERVALDIMARSIPGCTRVDNQTVPKSVLRGRCA